jgi:hypothetical protein
VLFLSNKVYIEISHACFIKFIANSPSNRLTIHKMSVHEDETVTIENQEIEVAADSTTGQMSVEDALQEVLRRALIHDGLARGLREAAKALDR